MTLNTRAFGALIACTATSLPSIPASAAPNHDGPGSISAASSQLSQVASPRHLSSVWRDYTNDRYGFSFDYPSPFVNKRADWNSRSGNSVKSVFVFNVRGPVVKGQYREAFGVNVYRLNVAIDRTLLPAVRRELKDVIKDLESQGTTIGNLRRLKLNGLYGFTAPASFRVAGVPFKSRLTFLFDGRLEFQLVEQTTASRWYKALPRLSQMRRSFVSF